MSFPSFSSILTAMQRSAAMSGGAIGIMSGRATGTWFGGWALANVFAASFRKSQCYSVPEGVGGGGIVFSFSCGRGPRLAGAKTRFVVRRANLWFKIYVQTADRRYGEVCHGRRSRAPGG
jgi:hypothetical protein